MIRTGIRKIGINLTAICSMVGNMSMLVSAVQTTIWLDWKRQRQ